LRAETLEDRILLSIASPPTLPLPAVADAVQTRIIPIDSDAHPDLVVLGSGGGLTVALNGGDGTWRQAQTTPLGVSGAAGMALGLFDGDAFVDLAVQWAVLVPGAPDGLLLASGDGLGRFRNFRSLPLGAPGSLAPPGGGSVGLEDFHLPGDYAADLAVVAPGTNEVLVLRNDGQGGFASPLRYASGGVAPVVVVTGSFVGDGLADLAVGHRDGSVTFFQGNPDGTFTPRPGLTVTGLGTVTGLEAADLDGDGETDLGSAAPTGPPCCTTPPTRCRSPLWSTATSPPG
jgi:hypothetical protein